MVSRYGKWGHSSENIYYRLHIPLIIRNFLRTFFRSEVRAHVHEKYSDFEHGFFTNRFQHVTHLFVLDNNHIQIWQNNNLECTGNFKRKQLCHVHGKKIWNWNTKMADTPTFPVWFIVQHSYTREKITDCLGYFDCFEEIVSFLNKKSEWHIYFQS